MCFSFKFGVSTKKIKSKYLIIKSRRVKIIKLNKALIPYIKVPKQNTFKLEIIFRKYMKFLIIIIFLHFKDKTVINK